MSVNSVASFPKVLTNLIPGMNPPENPPATRTNIPLNKLHSPSENLSETILPKSVLQVIENNPNDVSAILKAFQNLPVHDQRSFLENLNNAGINLGLDVNKLSNEKVAQIFKSEEFANNFSETFALARDTVLNDKISTTKPVEFINNLVAKLLAPATVTRNPDTATYATAA
jgi:hypothetical protein